MSETFDEALSMLKNTGPEFAEDEDGGLSNHGPMAAEALCRLGRDDAVIDWVEAYLPRLQEHPGVGKPLGSDWHSALGDYRRLPDWFETFDRALKEGPWAPTLDLWVGRLAPGLAAAATHGLIRTAHATRALAERDAPGRRRELAEGLSYWASRFQVLPGQPGPSPSDLAPSDALRRVTQLGVGTDALISEDLRALDRAPDFAGVVDLVDPSGEPERFLSDMTRTFAHAYLATVSSDQIIGMIHTVTGPSALRLMMPYLQQDTTVSALRYAWQAGAGIYAALTSTNEPVAGQYVDHGVDDLIDRSVATGDEHAIKFTEACLREHAVTADPVFLLAATDAVGRLNDD